MIAYLGPLFGQHLRILVLRRVDGDSLIEILSCDLWHVGLLRPDTSRQNEMLGYSRTLTSRGLELDVPALRGRVIVR